MVKPEFKSKEEAFVWLDNAVDEFDLDNYRFTFLDDAAGMTRYQEQVAEGCCGFADYDVIVDGRPAKVGCNYGH